LSGYGGGERETGRSAGCENVGDGVRSEGDSEDFSEVGDDAWDFSDVIPVDGEGIGVEKPYVCNEEECDPAIPVIWLFRAVGWSEGGGFVVAIYGVSDGLVKVFNVVALVISFVIE